MTCPEHTRVLARWRAAWPHETRSGYRRRIRDLTSQCPQCRDCAEEREAAEAYWHMIGADLPREERARRARGGRPC